MAHLRRVAIIALLVADPALAYSVSGQRGPEPVQAKAASSVSKKHVVRRSMSVAYRYWKKREPWIAAPRNYCKPKYIRVKWRRLKDPTVYGRTHIFGCTTLKKSVMVLNKRQEWPS